MTGDAVSVTEVPLGKAALQVPLQLMPTGKLVTLPNPVLVTERTELPVGICVKFAVTDLLASMLTVQDSLPEHAPDQLEKK